MKLDAQQITTFQETVWEYFREHERSMPWRERPTPYYVLVSELMLQQTQVTRVIPKFNSFIEQFSTTEILANATLAQVLTRWNGLGYNRRAKFLHEAAKMVQAGYGGHIPSTHEELVRLPGVGPNTAGAILAYAYNQPVVFIETNIRTVLMHHFFEYQFNIDDRALRDIAEQVLDHENPRHWYWALMDYGTHLKQTAGGRLDQSKHYKKQSPLAGSVREMRGRIIRSLSDGALSEVTLRDTVNADNRFVPALEALAAEGMIMSQNGTWCLTGDGDTR